MSRYLKQPGDDDLVSITEAGRRMGLTNLRANKRWKPDDFPDPDPTTGQGSQPPLYRYGRIRHWYETNFNTEESTAR